MPDAQLKGGYTTSDPRLDRLPEKDPQSRNFPVRRALPVDIAQTPTSRTWRCQAWLDQGQEGACTGFARAHNLAAKPTLEPNVTDALAEQIYVLAKTLDEWPGENYEGSSVLGAVKAAQQLGYIKEYHWAFSLEDFLLGMSYKGPAVIGINWYNDMFNVDPKGYLHKSGALAGGHSILVVAQRLYKGTGPLGLDLAKSYVTFHNSWGRNWGINGEARLSLQDFDALRNESAEVCFSTDIRKK